MNLHTKKIIAGTALLLCLGACSSESDDAERDINLTTGNEEPAPGRLAGTMANDYRDIDVELTPYATVEFFAGNSREPSGTVQFIGDQPGGGVRIFGRFSNLPQGNHSLRVLDSGDCTAVTGSVSGRIAGLDSAAQDAGTALPGNSGFIGNFTVGADSLASFELHVDELALEGSNSIIGKPMIVAAATDGGGAAQPANQTAEDHQSAIACGVIALNDVTASDQDAATNR